MEKLIVTLNATIDTAKIEGTVDHVCASEALSVSMKSTLKQYPGCVHWHVKNGKSTGVLEVTWWPRQEEEKEPLLWLSIHGNRMADWIKPSMLKLKQSLETKLRELV